MSAQYTNSLLFRIRESIAIALIKLAANIVGNDVFDMNDGYDHFYIERIRSGILRQRPWLSDIFNIRTLDRIGFSEESLMIALTHARMVFEEEGLAIVLEHVSRDDTTLLGALDFFLNIPTFLTERGLFNPRSNRFRTHVNDQTLEVVERILAAELAKSISKHSHDPNKTKAFEELIRDNL